MSRGLFARDPLADPEALIGRVYRYVAYRIGDGPDAEDVTSDVFERALRYRKSYDSSAGEPIAWLLGIASRSIADRMARRRDASVDMLEVEASGNLEDDTIRRLAVREAVASLGERDRELIALRFGADLSAPQIARLLGERTNTVEVALHRALVRLRPLFVDGHLPAGAEAIGTAL